MSITSTFTHVLNEDLEQYAFPSAMNQQQKHFIDRDSDGPWKLGIVQLEASMTAEQTQQLIHELTELHAFMVALKKSEIRRHTEPGPPAAEELAGVGL